MQTDLSRESRVGITAIPNNGLEGGREVSRVFSPMPSGKITTEHVKKEYE